MCVCGGGSQKLLLVSQQVAAKRQGPNPLTAPWGGGELALEAAGLLSSRDSKSEADAFLAF